MEKSKLLGLLIAFVLPFSAAAENHLSKEDLTIKVRPLSSVHQKRMTSLSAARGTGVGNDMDPYISQLRRRWSAGQVQTSSPMQSVLAWCNSIGMELKKAKAVAMANSRDQNYQQAYVVLFDTLDFLSRTMVVTMGNNGPLTKQIIDRGILLAHDLNQILSRSKRGHLIAKLNFMFEYIDLIVDVQKNFDNNYYIPFAYRHDKCRDRYGSVRSCPNNFNIKKMEKEYLRLAKKQLKFPKKLLAKQKV